MIIVEIENMIEKYNNKVLDVETLSQIELHPLVAEFNDMGASGNDPCLHWFDVQFVDGSEMDVYCGKKQWAEYLETF